MRYDRKFYIEPYVHINHNGTKVLLYNTYTNEVIISDNKEFFNDIKQFQETRRAIISISESTETLMQQLRENFFGDFIENNGGEIPVIVPGDLFKVVKNKEFLINKEERTSGNSISSNLFSLDIYLNNYKPKYNDISAQSILFTQESFFFDIKFLENLLLNLEAYKNLETINFFLSDNMSFDSSICLFERLKNNYNLNLSITSDLLDGIDNMRFSLFNQIYVQFFIEERSLNKILKSISINDKLKGRIFVESENDLDILDKYDVDQEKVEFIPFFNGSNSSFFEEAVFTDYESLFQEKINMRTIHKNSILNESDFGTLIIDSLGEVYTNLYCNSLGNLKTDDFNLIVQKAYYSDNSSWFATRKEAKTCKTCIYNALCPPISTFERLFKRNDLCFMNKQEP